jgi:hypothetical protein
VCDGAKCALKATAKNGERSLVRERFPSEARRPSPADALTELTFQTLWKIDAPAHLSNFVPFHEREARSISPSKTFLRPSDLNKRSVRHSLFPGAFTSSIS